MSGQPHSMARENQQFEEVEPENDYKKLNFSLLPYLHIKVREKKKRAFLEHPEKFVFLLSAPLCLPKIQICFATLLSLNSNPANPLFPSSNMQS